MALKPHLIGGAWVEGSDGQDNVNPSDLSDVVGVYGRADRALAEQAIAAAKAAFPAWSRSTPQQRFDILDAAGDEILARKAEIGELLSREEGKIRAEGVDGGGAGRPDLQVLRGRDAADRGRARGLGAARHRGRHHPRAARRGRADHALELSGRDPRLEDRAGAGLRQLRGAEARQSGAGLRLGAGRHPASRRRAGRRVQPRHGAGLHGRRGAAGIARRRGDQLHGLGRHRPARRRRLRRAPRQGAARDGRQEPAGGARRRRPADRGELRGQRRLLLDRPALHGVERA